MCRTSSFPLNLLIIELSKNLFHLVCFCAVLRSCSKWRKVCSGLGWWSEGGHVQVISITGHLAVVSGFPFRIWAIRSHFSGIRGHFGGRGCILGQIRDH